MNHETMEAETARKEIRSMGKRHSAEQISRSSALRMAALPGAEAEESPGVSEATFKQWRN